MGYGQVRCPINEDSITHYYYLSRIYHKSFVWRQLAEDAGALASRGKKQNRTLTKRRLRHPVRAKRLTATRPSGLTSRETIGWSRSSGRRREDCERPEGCYGLKLHRVKSERNFEGGLSTRSKDSGLYADHLAGAKWKQLKRNP